MLQVDKLLGTRVIVEEKVKEMAGLILPNEIRQTGDYFEGVVTHIGDLTTSVQVGDTIIYQFGFDNFAPLGRNARMGNETSIIAIISEGK